MGWLQRQLIEALQESDEARDTLELTTAVFGEEHARSHYVSAHRALRKLAEAGVIHRLDGRTRWNTCMWASLTVYAQFMQQEAGLAAYRQEQERFFRQFIEDMRRRYRLSFTLDEARKLFEKHLIESEPDSSA
jgi:hypothetical protein